MNLYDTLKDRVRLAARALALPLGWEGEPFVPPHASHMRAQVVFENQKQATLGMSGLTQINGRIEIKVVVKAGEDALAATLANHHAPQIRARLRRQAYRGRGQRGLLRLPSLIRTAS